MTRCACSHDVEQHHPAGRCTATLPADEAAELPAWGCPCRRAVPSAVTTRLLASVQSCTVLAPPRVPDQRFSLLLDLATYQRAHLIVDGELRGA